MQLLVLAAMLMVGDFTWGMAANVTRCEAYLTAPPELKDATLGLLKVKTSQRDRLAYREELIHFMRNAPNGSAEIANYLENLRRDSPDGLMTTVEAFAERLYVSYLLRPENFDLAVERLETLHRIFWVNFMYGFEDNVAHGRGYRRIRFDEGYAASEELLQFFALVAKTHPEKAALQWRESYDTFLPEILSLQDFVRILRRVVASLESLAVDANELPEEWESRDYVTMLVKELEHHIPVHSADHMIQFYENREELYRGLTFQKDMESARGSSLESITPLRTFVFLYRLNKRLPPEFRNERFLEVDLLITKIKRLLTRVHLPAHAPPQQ